MTRGGWYRGTLGGSNGAVGLQGDDVTRSGLIQPKPMMTRVCKTPPEKKFQKKFRRSNFFFKKKIFAGLGGFCHHGFLI